MQCYVPAYSIIPNFCLLQYLAWSGILLIDFSVHFPRFRPPTRPWPEHRSAVFRWFSQRVVFPRLWYLFDLKENRQWIWVGESSIHTHAMRITRFFPHADTRGYTIPCCQAFTHSNTKQSTWNHYCKGDSIFKLYESAALSLILPT